MTLSILWEEYIAQQPDGLRYSRFCELYRTFASKLPVVMRQTHAAGEKAVRGLCGRHGAGEWGLTGMAKAFAELLGSGETTRLTLTEGLGLLLGHETSYRDDKRLASRLRYARALNRYAIARCCAAGNQLRRKRYLGGKLRLED